MRSNVTGRLLAVLAVCIATTLAGAAPADDPLAAFPPLPAGPKPPDFAAELATRLPRAEAGSPEDLYRVAQMYKAGLGTAASLPNYRLWIVKAAERGHAYAQVELAQELEQGFAGFRRDLAQAFAWNLRAAKQGMPAVYQRVAQHYAEGQGTARDVAEAYYWELIAFNYDGARVAVYQQKTVKDTSDDRMIAYLTPIVRGEEALLAAYRMGLSAEQQAAIQARAAAFKPRLEI